jgi:hypothetical protein
MNGFGFQGLIFTLERWGIVDVILPFILIFTIVFAVLQKINLFGKDENDVDNNRKYSAIIAAVVAFAVIIPHVTGSYYYGFDAVVVINQALPQVGLLLVAIVMMLLTVGLWTGKGPNGKGINVWFTGLSVLIVIGIFLASIGRWNVPSWLFFLVNNDVISLVIAVLVFGLVIRFIASPSDKGKDNKDKKTLGKLLEESYGK